MVDDPQVGGLRGGGGWVPQPDPTILTTEQLNREIARVQELIDLEIKAVDERLTAAGAEACQ